MFKMNRLLTITLAVVLASATGMVFAKKSGHAGGKSASHMSEEGAANTNGAGSAEKVRGQDRANERRNHQGEEHNKAGKKDKGDAQTEKSHSGLDL